ncbi:MAG: chitobiase/beta-hexosaminidase C-terminal domain-containing protein, partial [Bacteroidales bacterium]|nr:chitobiase/beta-hexosaminidase C-terminal domain-containing protein [Bacteroidales bacterium]
TGVTYGRLSDGSFSLLSSPSFGFENDDASAFVYYDGGVEINVPSGVYASAQSIELSNNSGSGAIHYTLDGSIPTSSSLVYSAPISVTENTVLKARIIVSASEYSMVENRSYIIGADHDLPLVILTSDNANGGESMKLNIDGRVEFCFIDEEGNRELNQYADFRVSGKTSKNIPQLNGKLEANESYGDGDFDYKMFPNKDLDEYRGFLLRNASQDWSETHMRDAFVSRLLSTDNLSDFPFEGYRPAVLYVNAEYHGIINIREDDDSNYIKDNYSLASGDYQKMGRDFPTYEFTTDRDVLENILDFNDYINLNFLIAYTNLNEWGFGSWKDLSGTTDHLIHFFNHDFDATFGLRGFEYVPFEGMMSLYGLVPYE